MEFNDLGKHCSYCLQKDFLPVQCNYCKDYFCKIHYNYCEHECESKNLQDLLVGVEVKAKEVKKRSRCSKCKRKFTSSNILVCGKCNQKVCYEHHLTFDHSCITVPNCKVEGGKLTSQINRGTIWVAVSFAAMVCTISFFYYNYL
jgi:hypothetical protein